MFYLELHDGERSGWTKVFTTLHGIEAEMALDRFRVAVRAPKSALRQALASHERPFVVVYGQPRLAAIASVPNERTFANPEQRMAWERTALTPPPSSQQGARL